MKVTSFFRKLREISTEVIPVFGCSDLSQKGLLEVLQELSFSEEPLKPQLLKPSPVRAEAVRSLLVFYTVAKEKVRVKLADGSVAIFRHGHDLGFGKKDYSEEIAEALFSRKRPEDIYVIGHCHKSFLDPEKKVAILGSWQTRTHEDKENGFIPDVMDILLIKEDGTLRLVRGS